MKVKTEASTAEEMRDIIAKWHRQQASEAANRVRSCRLQRERVYWTNKSSFHHDAAEFISGIEVIR